MLLMAISRSDGKNQRPDLRFFGLLEPDFDFDLLTGFKLMKNLANREHVGNFLTVDLAQGIFASVHSLARCIYYECQKAAEENHAEPQSGLAISPKSGPNR